MHIYNLVPHTEQNLSAHDALVPQFEQNLAFCKAMAISLATVAAGLGGA